MQKLFELIIIGGIVSALGLMFLDCLLRSWFVKSVWSKKTPIVAWISSKASSPTNSVSSELAEMPASVNSI